jgi:TPR repeat protein
MSGFVNHDDSPELERAYAAFDAGNYPEAFRLYLPLADAGVAYAQSTLGSMLCYGLGVEQDVAQGLMWYLRAADQGLPLAFHNLGTLYFGGAIGLPSDPGLAWEYFRKAKELGFEMPMPMEDDD